MTAKTSSTEHKSEIAADKHFKDHEHIQQLAVIHKGDAEARVSVFSRQEGERVSISFPLDHDLEYAAQQLLYRYGSIRETIIYA